MAESKDTGARVATRTAFDIAGAVESSQIHLAGLNKTLWFCVANAATGGQADGKPARQPELVEHVFALVRAMEHELQILSAAAHDVYALAHTAGTTLAVPCATDREA